MAGQKLDRLISSALKLVLLPSVTALVLNDDKFFVKSKLTCLKIVSICSHFFLTQNNICPHIRFVGVWVGGRESERGTCWIVIIL